MEADFFLLNWLFGLENLYCDFFLMKWLFLGKFVSKSRFSVYSCSLLDTVWKEIDVCMDGRWSQNIFDLVSIINYRSSFSQTKVIIRSHKEKCYKLTWFENLLEPDPGFTEYNEFIAFVADFFRLWLNRVSCVIFVYFDWGFILLIFLVGHVLYK